MIGVSLCSRCCLCDGIVLVCNGLCELHIDTPKWEHWWRLREKTRFSTSGFNGVSNFETAPLELGQFSCFFARMDWNGQQKLSAKMGGGTIYQWHCERAYVSTSLFVGSAGRIILYHPNEKFDVKSGLWHIIRLLIHI